MSGCDFSRRAFLRRGVSAAAAGAASGTLLPRMVFAAKEGDASGETGRQAIACLRKEAADAAAEILKEGGNAIDAAIAELMVLFVIEPRNVSLGGYGGSLVYYQAKSEKVFAIDHDARAPRTFDPATFNSKSAYHGYFATGVPGNAAGVELARKKFATMPFEKLSRAAVGYCENGLPVSKRMASDFQSLVKDMDADSRKAFLPNGVLKEGETWVQKDLGRLIRRLGEEGIDALYNGDIARQIVTQFQKNGGPLTEEDFHGFAATAVEPLWINYRGFDVYTPPPPSGGLTSLSILKTLEQFDVPNMKPWGADYVELFAAASNLAWQERFEYSGDPGFVEIPVDDLLSENRARERAAAIREKKIPAAQPPADSSTHTVNLVIVDKESNVVSWTATHGADFGAHVAIGGLGLMLGHGMSRFDQDKSSPNYPAPKKRPQHNMSPVVVLRNGKPHAGLGLPGGRMIVTVTAQLAVDVLDFHGSAKQTVTAPRIHTEGSEPIQVTATTAPEVVAELRRRGHGVTVKPALGAAANAIVLRNGGRQLDAADSAGPGGVLVF